MSSMLPVASALAMAFLAGAWERSALVARGAEVLGERPEWLSALVRGILRRWPCPPHDDHRRLAQSIGEAAAFRRARVRGRLRRRIAKAFAAPVEMGATPWPVPPIPTTHDLAIWLGLTDAELDWFANVRYPSTAATAPRLEHYRYRWLPKLRGGLRLVEAPKPRLKGIQQQILREILDPIPAHPTAHGFVRGRSVLSFVAPHARRSAVIRLDLEDFFTTVRRRRVHGVFRGAGYPDCVAESLAALCTHALPGWHWARAPRPDLRTPAEDEDHGRAGVLLRSNHLPQGAPTSPALANLACYRLDCRLSRAAAAVGAEYTRYADDLAFSGDESFGARAARFVAFAGGIAMDEGFRVNFRKTRIMRASQRQELAGLVVNRGPNQRRRELERLEATLYNAVRYGPSSQNREQHPDFRAHLQGRISWVRQVSQTRAARLEELFEQIPW